MAEPLHWLHGASVLRGSGDVESENAVTVVQLCPLVTPISLLT